jgi:hypothetical protein
MVILLLLGGCAAPAEVFDDTAATLGLSRRDVRGAPFRHATYTNHQAAGTILNVYLEGDGTPMIASRPAGDPTPRHPLVLRLMALDPDAAVLLGRPCYHGLNGDPQCRPELWTSARYSDAVVTSMASALRRLMDDGHIRCLRWFGYSGGGTLAMLLAERFSETVSVTTVAANIDVTAWAEHRALPPLIGSLNPADRPPLPRHVVQRHYVGARDAIVPPSVTEAGLRRRGARPIIIADADHVSGWEAFWPQVLMEENAQTFPQCGATPRLP